MALIRLIIKRTPLCFKVTGNSAVSLIYEHNIQRFTAPQATLRQQWSQGFVAALFCASVKISLTVKSGRSCAVPVVYSVNKAKFQMSLQVQCSLLHCYAEIINRISMHIRERQAGVTLIGTHESHPWTFRNDSHWHPVVTPIATLECHLMDTVKGSTCNNTQGPESLTIG